MALVNWTTVCCSKHLGNLGVIYLYHFGRALKLRWNWYDWTDVERPWAGSLIDRGGGGPGGGFCLVFGAG